MGESGTVRLETESIPQGLERRVRRATAPLPNVVEPNETTRAERVQFRGNRNLGPVMVSRPLLLAGDFTGAILGQTGRTSVPCRLQVDRHDQLGSRQARRARGQSCAGGSRCAHPRGESVRRPTGHYHCSGHQFLTHAYLADRGFKTDSDRSEHLVAR